MSSIVIAGDTSGSVTLQAPAIAGSTILTLPATSGTIQTSGAGYTANGVAYASSTSVLTTGSALTFDGNTLTAVNTSGNAIIASRGSKDLRLTGNYAGANTHAAISTTTGMALAFMDESNEYMRLTSTGLGIGTSSPATKLAVAGGISGTAGLNISGAGWGVLPYVANSLVIDNNGGETRFFATGADASTDGSFLFYTGQTDGGANERMRIDTSGNLLVGTTSLVSAGKIEVATSAATNQGLNIKDTSGSNNLTYCAFFNSSGTVAGTITHTGSTTVAYNTSSDYRLKENIAPMTGALNTVAQLKPVTYKWKEDQTAGQGFIAHELQAVVPDCVTGEKDAVDEDGNPKYQGIDTSFLVATLTAALQEAHGLITQLQADVAALKGA